MDKTRLAKNEARTEDGEYKPLFGGLVVKTLLTKNKARTEDGENKALFGGLVVKTWLAHYVFRNDEKQTDFDQDGIEQVGTKSHQDGIGTDFY